MDNGLYRLHYTTGTLSTNGVIVLEDGTVSGCDRYYFMTGNYRCQENRFDGTATFKRHTERPGPLRMLPLHFDLVFKGVSSDKFGQFDVHCPDIPAIRGTATFFWIGELNGQDRVPPG